MDGNGFFQVERVGGRWRFVDPEGNPFFSTGVCNVSAQGFSAPDLGSSPYYKNILELYGSKENWANVTKDRMDTWDFNTLGAWCDKYIMATGLNYTLQLNMTGAKWVTGEIPDYFSEEWLEHANHIGREVVANYSNDKNCLGYFLDNELHWGPDWRTLDDLFAVYCNMSSDSPGKVVLVRFLKDKYKGDIKKFNRSWRTHFKSFNEILEVTCLGSGIHPKSIRARNDRREFTYIVAEQYFKVCHETIRKYDENHLILGARFTSCMTPREVVKACSPYVDVVSVNYYPIRSFILPIATIILDKMLNFVNAKNMLQEYHDITNKPIIISEINSRAWDSGLPNTKPSPILLYVFLTQKQRADHIYNVMIQFIEKNYSIGYHWFAYMDEPRTGRFDGENSNMGIVNVKDKPYRVLVEKLCEINNLSQNIVKY